MVSPRSVKSVLNAVAGSSPAWPTKSKSSDIVMCSSQNETLRVFGKDLFQNLPHKSNITAAKLHRGKSVPKSSLRRFREGCCVVLKALGNI